MITSFNRDEMEKKQRQDMFQHYYRSTTKLLFKLSNDIQDYYRLRRLKESIKNGHLLHASDVTMWMSIIKESKIAQTVALSFIHAILQDYLENKAFFLKSNNEDVLNYCVEGLTRLEAKLASELRSCDPWKPCAL